MLLTTTWSPYARYHTSRQASGLHYISVSLKHWAFNCIVNSCIVSFMNTLCIVFFIQVNPRCFCIQSLGCCQSDILLFSEYVYSWKIKENYEKELLTYFISALVFHVSCLSILQYFINIQEHLYNKLWPLNILY